MAVAYLTAGDALDDVRRLEDGGNQQAPGDAHDAMAVFETFDPPEIPDVDNRMPEVTEEMLTIPIARGWERQIDRRLNPEFYDGRRRWTRTPTAQGCCATR